MQAEPVAGGQAQRASLLEAAVAAAAKLNQQAGLPASTTPWNPLSGLPPPTADVQAAQAAAAALAAKGEPGHEGQNGRGAAAGAPAAPAATTAGQKSGGRRNRWSDAEPGSAAASTLPALAAPAALGAPEAGASGVGLGWSWEGGAGMAAGSAGYVACCLSWEALCSCRLLRLLERDTHAHVLRLSSRTLLLYTGGNIAVPREHVARFEQVQAAIVTVRGRLPGVLSLCASELCVQGLAMCPFCCFSCTPILCKNVA